MAATNDNEALHLLKQQQEEEEELQKQYETSNLERSRQIAEYNVQIKPLEIQMQPLQQQINVLKNQIYNLERQRDVLAKQDDSKTLENAKRTSRKNLETALVAYLKDNTKLVYTQLREQSRKAKQIYDNFVCQRVTNRLTDNQFISDAVQSGKNRLTALEQNKKRIMITPLPYRESQDLLKEVEDKIIQVENETKQYQKWLTRLEDKDTDLCYFGLSDDPRLVRRDRSDIVETYHKLQAIYNDWFKLYNEIWQHNISDNYSYPYDSNRLSIRSLYEEVLPFFRLYVKFQEVFCDSGILNDKTCDHCGGGLRMIGDRLEVNSKIGNIWDADYTIRFESHSVHVSVPSGFYQQAGDNDYNKSICEERKKNYHF